MGGELCRLPFLIRRPIIRHSGQLRGFGFRLGAVPLVGVRLTLRRGGRFRPMIVHRLGGVSGVVHHLMLFYRPFFLCGRFSGRIRHSIIRCPFKPQPSAAIVYEAGGTLFNRGRRLDGIRGMLRRLPLSGFLTIIPSPPFS